MYLPDEATKVSHFKMEVSHYAGSRASSRSSSQYSQFCHDCIRFQRLSRRQELWAGARYHRALTQRRGQHWRVVPADFWRQHHDLNRVINVAPSKCLYSSIETLFSCMMFQSAGQMVLGMCPTHSDRPLVRPLATRGFSAPALR